MIPKNEVPCRYVDVLLFPILQDLRFGHDSGVVFSSCLLNSVLLFWPVIDLFSDLNSIIIYEVFGDVLIDFRPKLLDLGGSC